MVVLLMRVGCIHPSSQWLWN